MAADDGTREMPVRAWRPPAQRSEAEPPLPGWAAHEETVSLPAFLTSQSAPPPAKPAPAKPARPSTDISEKLPSTERNMLIFVAALLAIGTLAIVAMASIGR